MVRVYVDKVHLIRLLACFLLLDGRFSVLCTDFYLVNFSSLMVSLLCDTSDPAFVRINHLYSPAKYGPEGVQRRLTYEQLSTNIVSIIIRIPLAYYPSFIIKYTGHASIFVLSCMCLQRELSQIERLETTEIHSREG